MMRRLMLLSLVVACTPTGDDTTDSTGSTGEESESSSDTTATTGESSTTGDDTTSSTTTGDDTTGDTTGHDTTTGSTTEELTTDATEPTDTDTDTDTSTGGPVCGDGFAEPPEECDDGEDTVLCDGDCTAPACGDGYANPAAGEECDDGNADDTDECLTTCKAASCGDGIIGPGEECDGGEQCDDDCTVSRWAHVGPAMNISEGDLVKWSECFSTTYESTDALDDVIGPMNGSCQGDHLALACRKVGSDTLTAIAHAPRADVLWPTEGGTDVHAANGSDWYYDAGSWGFLPDGSFLSKSNCDTTIGADDDAARLCWMVNKANFSNLGWRCGDFLVPLSQGAEWERVVFDTFDG